MDSPVEFGPLSLRQFSVGAATFRVAVHHTGTRRRARSLRAGRRAGRARRGRDLRRVPGLRTGPLHVSRRLPAVRRPRRHGAPEQHGHDLVREHPVPTARGCSARWRTSSSTTGTSSGFARATSSRSISIARTCRATCGWPRASREYYGPLALQRAGLASLAETGHTFGDLVDIVLDRAGTVGAFRRRDEPHGAVHRRRPNRSIAPTGPTRSSRITRTAAPLRSRWISRCAIGPTAAPRSTTSCARCGACTASPAASREGYVDRPYTTDDAQARLAEVSGDAAFARDFFDRYIRGREVADYARLLQRAGFVGQEARRAAAPGGATCASTREATGPASAPWCPRTHRRTPRASIRTTR